MVLHHDEVTLEESPTPVLAKQVGTQIDFSQGRVLGEYDCSFNNLYGTVLQLVLADVKIQHLQTRPQQIHQQHLMVLFCQLQIILLKL